MTITTSPTSRFQAGRLLLTEGVHTLAQEGRLHPVPYLHRHLRGDWGDLSHQDRLVNEQALQFGGRLFSSYQIDPDLTLWIITEWHRRATTLLLPSEY